MQHFQFWWISSTSNRKKISQASLGSSNFHHNESCVLNFKGSKGGIEGKWIQNLHAQQEHIFMSSLAYNSNSFHCYVSVDTRLIAPYCQMLWKKLSICLAKSRALDFCFHLLGGRWNESQVTGGLSRKSTGVLQQLVCGNQMKSLWLRVMATVQMFID